MALATSARLSLPSSASAETAACAIQWPAEVNVQLFLARVGNSSFTVGFRIVDRGDPSRLYADGDNVLVWTARSTGKSTPLPECVREALK